MKAVVSIPVHEKAEIIVDQINNIKKFFPEAYIVLHVSEGFYEAESDETFRNMEGVWINPEHLKTSWGNIVMTHISNFIYADKILEFDYFVMHSSNDMYIRRGVADYIQKYDAGIHIHPIICKKTKWWPTEFAWDDPWLRHIMKLAGQETIYASQLEGSFYTRPLMRYVCEVIMQSVNDGFENTKEGEYTREEFFYPTVAMTRLSTERITTPFVYSEVHQFDRMWWKRRDICYGVYQRILHYFMSSQKYDELIQKYHDVMVDRKNYKVTIWVIKKIIRGTRKNKAIRCDLNDGRTQYKLYLGTEFIYAVKRVERNMNSKARVFIDEHL